jgi:hypothetical protein
MKTTFAFLSWISKYSLVGVLESRVFSVKQYCITEVRISVAGGLTEISDFTHDNHTKLCYHGAMQFILPMQLRSKFILSCDYNENYCNNPNVTQIYFTFAITMKIYIYDPCNYLAILR